MLQIADVVNRVGKEDLTARYTDIGRGDELGSLGRSFNTILIVEDHPDNLLTLRAILNETGAKQTPSSGGTAFLDPARQTNPDLILMDIQLPGMSGLELTEQIKGDSTLKSIPVVALTARAMKGDREKILASGLDDYVSKPIDPADLMNVLRKWLT